MSSPFGTSKSLQTFIKKLGIGVRPFAARVVRGIVRMATTPVTGAAIGSGAPVPNFFTHTLSGQGWGLCMKVEKFCCWACVRVGFAVRLQWAVGGLLYIMCLCDMREKLCGGL